MNRDSSDQSITQQRQWFIKTQDRQTIEYFLSLMKNHLTFHLQKPCDKYFSNKKTSFICAYIETFLAWQKNKTVPS